MKPAKKLPQPLSGIDVIDQNLPVYLYSQGEWPSFSIVINTLNRSSELKKTLHSLLWLQYDGDFEVVVVNGPSTDDTLEMLESWAGKIRILQCSKANLSVSRNIGICAAAGDVVAFLDDDAIPEPEWLSQLALAYANPHVGGVGGFVFNHTGCDFQYSYGVVDRLGNPDLEIGRATPGRSFPGSDSFPHLLGCNSSFRKSALLDIGGFDEEYEYFLDETDVCLRLVDAGHLIAQLPCAFVHHKYAPSDIRGDNRIVKNRYPIIKNKIYFMLKNARSHYSLDQIFSEQERFLSVQENEVKWAVEEGLLTQSDSDQFYLDMERAIECGVKRGFEGVTPQAYITEEKQKCYYGVFKTFNTQKAKAGKSLVLVSRGYPPYSTGGVATFNRDLAQSLAGDGNIVHVICETPGAATVDFEEGVWVHRINSREYEICEEVQQVPRHIWGWSASALNEVERIAKHRVIDIVEAPIWDCEGIAFLQDGRWPLVTSLQTTLHFWLQSHPDMRADGDWMKRFGCTMLALEKRLMEKSHAIRSISGAIRQDIECAYDIAFEDERIVVAHLGMPMLAGSARVSKPVSPVLRVLFVGRLEHRKGIDVLLRVVSTVLKQHQQVEFRVVGDDTLNMPGKSSSYKEAFQSSAIGQAYADKVRFLGQVSDEVLQDEYANCDIFVAPSRFESFGLVFLEAMRYAKPVIGCNVGGMPEIIEHNQTGILCKPGDVTSLGEALLRLCADESLRKNMGDAGQQRFEQCFTSLKMAEKTVQLYAMAADNFQVA